ncbi:MAG: hypothetical protein OEL76_16485 [Siculibacillus sp.]|nr:hypothetical protein [Siculibacillus sp.]
MPTPPAEAPAVTAPDAAAPAASAPATSDTFGRRRRVVVVALIVAGVAAFAAAVMLRPDDGGRPGSPMATAPPPSVVPPPVVMPKPPPPAVSVPMPPPVAAPPAPPPPPIPVAPPVVAPPPAAWTAIDSIALGLAPIGRRPTSGISYEIPAGWKRVPLPDRFLLAHAPPGAVEGVTPRIVVEAIDVPGRVLLADEAEVVKSIARDGGDDFAVKAEGSTRVALRDGRRLSIVFKAMDDPGLRRQEFVFVQAGRTVFKLLVDGAASDPEVGRVFDHVVGSLAVKE